MVRINTESQPINKLVKIINMKNIGLDRLIGPDVLSQCCDYFHGRGNYACSACASWAAFR